MSKLLNNIQNVSLGYDLRFQILNEFLDIPSVLNYLNIKFRKHGDECLGNCPYHDDKHPSWSINVEKTSEFWAVHHCFSCKASGNIVSLVRDINGITYKEAFVWLEEFAGIDGEDLDIESLLLDKQLALKNTQKVQQGGEIHFDFPGVRTSQKAMNYLKKRNVTSSQIDRHGIRVGTGKYANSVVFPIRNQHGVSTFYARFYEGGKKGVYAVGKDKIKNTLYNYYNCDFLINMAYLVEGCFDVLAVERALISMGSKNYKNVFATLGPVLYDNQVRLLDFFDNIVVIPDMKGGAESLIPSCKDLLRQKLYLVELDSGEDPDSTSIEVLVERIEQMTDARESKNVMVIDYG